MTSRNGSRGGGDEPTRASAEEDLDLLLASAMYLGHIADNVRRNVRGQGTALDIGCGPGLRDLKVLRLLGIDFAVGIDVQKDVEKPRALGIEYVRADADDSNLPFAEGTFDLILLDNVIEHLYHPGSVLEECRRCLRKDGRLALLTPNQARLINRIRLPLGRSVYYPLDYWLGSGEEHLTRRGRSYFAGHIREYTSGEIELMLTRSGFDVESMVLYAAGRPSLREEMSKSRIALRLYNIAEKVVPNSKYMISAVAKRR